jgi:dipeptidase E
MVAATPPYQGGDFKPEGSVFQHRRLLLLSNSRNTGQEYLEHARPFIRDFLTTVRRVLFLPYAAVTRSFDEYARLVKPHFAEMGFDMESMHRMANPERAIRDAEAIVIGGGNTFHLLKCLYATDAIGTIRERVAAGVPYIGWSAGSNVASPTIRTTNDMPIVEPPGFSALGIVPFQINPHYLDAHPEGHQGETREERILEFIEVNEGIHVVGLREGSLLRIEAQTIRLLGSKSARIFIRGGQPREYSPEDSLQFLLEG